MTEKRKEALHAFDDARLAKAISDAHDAYNRRDAVAMRAVLEQHPSAEAFEMGFMYALSVANMATAYANANKVVANPIDVMQEVGGFLVNLRDAK